MPDTTQSNPLLTRAASFAPDSYNADTRTIDVVWSTGADVMRSDWFSGSRYIERLSMAPKSVRLDRLNGGAPFLAVHNAGSVEAVVGVVVDGSARIVDGQGVATVLLSGAPSAADVVAKIAEGVLRSVSVGFVIHATQTTAARDGVPEVRTATDWEPMELSIVPIPADAGAKVRSADPAQQQPEPPAQEPVMSEPTNVVDIAAERKNAAAEERARVAAILDISKRHQIDLQGHIDGGKSVDEARAAALDALAAKQAATEISGTQGGVKVKVDERDHRRAAMTEAMDLRLGLIAPEKIGAGRRYAGRSLQEMFRQALSDEGVRGVADMSRDEVWHAVASPFGQRSMTTSDFPLALANSLNKALLASFSFAPTTWEMWTARKQYRDFRPHPSVGMGAAPGLALLPEGDSITYGSIGEQSNSTQAFRYARGLSFSEQTFINDDLDAIRRSINSWGAVAAAKAESLCIAVLTANANLGDGNALFSSAHANIIASATTPTTVANIDAAIQIMDAQTEPGGNDIIIEPAMCLVSSNYDLQTRQALGLVVSAQTATTNVIPQGSSLSGLQVVKVKGLPTTYWYLAASPMVAPVVEAGYLEGRNGPVLQMESDFDTKGIRYSLHMDFGAGAIDHRGMVRVANS